MPRGISLSEIVAAMQFGDGTTVTYFNPTTGEIVRPRTVSEEMAQAPHAARPEDLEPLPVFSEQDEIELARQFADTVDEAEDQQRLRQALASATPREAFESALFRCRIANEWFRFRDDRLLRLAKDWLEAHHLPYIDDITRQAD